MKLMSVLCFAIVTLFTIFLEAQASEDVQELSVSDISVQNVYETDSAQVDLLVGAALGPTEALKTFINLVGREKVNGTTRLGETVLTELVEYLDLKYTPGDFHERFGIPYDRALIFRNIKVLVDLGLDMDGRNESGETALIKSIREGYFEGREARYIKKLIELGANPDAKDIRGETALFAVVRHKPKNSQIIMETLIQWGAETDALNYQGVPLLGVAMENGNYEGMRRLVRLEADMEVQNLQGVPLLTVAMENGNYEGMRRLVELGADPDVTDRMGQTALSEAIFSHSFVNERGAEVLIELGADANAVVAGGQNILQRVLSFYAQQVESLDYAQRVKTLEDRRKSKRVAEKRIRFLLLNGANVSEDQAQQVIDILGRQKFQELAKSQKLKTTTLNNCYNAVAKVGPN